MSVTDKPKSYTNNNVYILGAGFAKDAGYPLVADFLNRARDSVAWLEGQGDRQREVDAVAEVLKFRLDAASAAYRVRVDVEDIEQLFSLASARDAAGASLSAQVKLCIAATLDYARHQQLKGAAVLGVMPSEEPYSTTWVQQENTSQSDPERLYQMPAYHYYAGMMAGGFCGGTSGENTIITLNYDTLVEDALLDMGYAVSYGFAKEQTDADQSWKDRQGDRGSTVPVLKLHGSVNWAYPGRQGQRLTIFGSYDDVRGRELVPTLVPPTWRKEFGEPLGNVWAEAVRAIERATRIFVVGFSIPDTDPHFKYLLAAGLQENISLRKLFYANPALREGDPQRAVLTKRLLSILRRELMKKELVVAEDWNTEHLFFSNEDRGVLHRGPSGAFALRALNLVTFS